MIYKAEPGEVIFNFVKRMIAEMWDTNEVQRNCEFNNIHLLISKDSFVNDIMTIYSLKRELSFS